jgi:hypothetical protein
VLSSTRNPGRRARSVWCRPSMICNQSILHLGRPPHTVFPVFYSSWAISRPILRAGPKACLCPLHRFHPHTLTQRNLYRLTSIVETNVFESNGPRRANQNADYTSGNPALDEFGQPADLAAQPKLGVLPEWGLGPGRCRPTRFVTPWKNLKLVADWKSGDPLSARRTGTGCQFIKPGTRKISRF